MAEIMTEEQARAHEAAWGRAAGLVRPLVEMAEEIGHPEFRQLMQEAHVRASDEVNRALDVTEPIDYPEG